MLGLAVLVFRGDLVLAESLIRPGGSGYPVPVEVG